MFCGLLKLPATSSLDLKTIIERIQYSKFSLKPAEAVLKSFKNILGN